MNSYFADIFLKKLFEFRKIYDGRLPIWRAHVKYTLRLRIFKLENLEFSF